MGMWDVIESAAGGVADLATEVGPLARAAPGLGELISASQTAYHVGSAGYDAITGDRDGAVNHGTQAVVNGIGAIPGVHEAVGGVDIAGSAMGARARLASMDDPRNDAGLVESVLGISSAEEALEVAAVQGGHFARDHDIPTSEIPGGIDDLAGSLAVLGTNAIFGADDTNWIADGDTPQGTRSGEIGAGTAVMGAMWGAPMMPPLGPALGAWGGWELGNEIGDRTSPGEPTSGAEPGFAAAVGQALHAEISGEAVTERAEEQRRSRSRQPRQPRQQRAEDMPAPRGPRTDPASRRAQEIAFDNRESQTSILANRAGVPMDRLMRLGPDGEWIYDEEAIAAARATVAERDNGGDAPAGPQLSPGTRRGQQTRAANREREISILANRAGVPMDSLMRLGPDGDWIYDADAITAARARVRGE